MKRRYFTFPIVICSPPLKCKGAAQKMVGIECVEYGASSGQGAGTNVGWLCAYPQVKPAVKAAAAKPAAKKEEESEEEEDSEEEEEEEVVVKVCNSVPTAQSEQSV